MQKFIFDGPNRLFIAKPGVTSFNVKVDLYSDWKEELLLGDNLKWAQALRTIGGDPKGAAYAGSTFFLMNNWKIRPQEANHTLVIDGDLWLDTATHTGPMFVPTLGGFTVLMETRLSLLVETVATGSVSPEDVAEAVWDEQAALHVTPGSLGKDIAEIKATNQAVYQDMGDLLDLAEDLHDEALGKWTLNPATSTLTLYRGDGSVLQVFKLKTAVGDVPPYVERAPV